MQPLNILEIVSGGFGGGSSRQAYLLTKGLHQRGHKVKLACSRRESEGYQKMAQDAAAAGLPLVDIPMTGEGDFHSIKALRALMHREKFDIVHAHKATAHTLAFLALLFSPPKPKPRLVVQRGVIFPLRKNPFSKIKYRWGVAKIVAVSLGVKAALLEGGIREDNIEVIYNGVDLELFVPQLDGTPVKSSLGVPGDSPVVTIIGNQYPHKGHQYFLEAAARVKPEFPRAHYLIVGGGDDAFSLELQQKTRELGLNDRVIFTGSREDIPRILAATDILVNASLQEGLPGTVQEASAMARPVVATKVGGNPEAVLHGQTGLLVPPRDPPSMATAIISLLENPSQARAMGAAGRQLMEEKFSHQRRVDLTENLFYRLLENES
jgi:glycosyltransferase involved in cell wall biosynthesis